MDDAEAIWEEIERSESYLVCSTYEEALELASSVLKRISRMKIGCENDMLEAAGMALGQSLKELGRTSRIVDELKLSFSSVAAIPWSLSNEEIYVLVGSRNIDDREHCDGHALLTVDEYLQVVEVYLQMLLAIGSKDMDVAVSWVEKAALPEEKRQVLLRRSDYLQSLKAASLSQSSSSLLKDDCNAHLSSLEEPKKSRASKAAVNPGYHQDGESAN
ncbi:Protein APEM9, partial [Cucurbita argyrosperma subsp. argyrosperma]